MKRIRIEPDAPLNYGDIVELHFKSVGMTWIKAAQIALIESRLKKRKDFFVLSITTPASEPTKIIFKVKVLQIYPPDFIGPLPPYGVYAETQEEIQEASVIPTALVIAGVIITAGIVYKLTLQDTFKIVAESGQTAVESISEVVTSPTTKIALPVLAILALYKYLK